MKINFKLLSFAFLTSVIVSSAAYSIGTVCPDGKSTTCVPSEMRCPKGYQMALGCGGCDGAPEPGRECVPNFSQCECIKLSE